MMPFNPLSKQMISFCLFLFCFTHIAYPQDILWEKSFGGKHAEYLTDVQPTADFGFILAGSSLSGKSGNKSGKNNGDLDYWIWKMDEKGDFEWQKDFGGNGSDFLQNIKLTKDGGFILAGTSNSPEGLVKKDSCRGNDDFWIIKLDAKGGEQWQRTIGGNGQEKLHSISQTKDGGYIIGGSSDSSQTGEKTSKGFGSLDYWIVKLDKEGKIQWQNTYGGFYLDELRSLEQTRDNGYILGGYSNSPQSGNKISDHIGIGDYWIIKLDKDGEKEWEKTLGGNNDDQLALVHQTYDDGYIIGGSSISQADNSKSKSNGKGSDFWIVKLDIDGTIKWQETYDFDDTDVLTSLVENKDHTILLGGFTKSGSEKGKDKKGINDYIALKISENGDQLWDTSVGSDGEDILRKVIETRDGGYVLAGTSNPVKIESAAQNTKTNRAMPKTSGSTQGNQKVNDVSDKANNQVKEITDSINEEYKEATGKLTDKINSTTNAGKDSALKTGINKPENLIGKSPTIGNSGNGNTIDDLMSGMGNQKTMLPASGDKKANYGNNDFWVVKLKDKSKSKYQKPSGLEAMPNPTSQFTNVIVNYEFETGTATIVDINGRILEQMEISSRTVPIDLSGYPVGIYIVNIKTNVQSEGIKVVKN